LLALVWLLNCHLTGPHCGHHVPPKQPFAIKQFAARAKVIAGRFQIYPVLDAPEHRRLLLRFAREPKSDARARTITQAATTSPTKTPDPAPPIGTAAFVQMEIRVVWVVADLPDRRSTEMATVLFR
jgi:hypothetical protein